jgi:hypothetical protein
MSRFHFRFRTILITIAALAVMMGLLKLLAHHFGVAVASVGIDRSNLVISFEPEPDKWKADVPGPGNVTFSSSSRSSSPSWPWPVTPASSSGVPQNRRVRRCGPNHEQAPSNGAPASTAPSDVPPAP